MRHPVCCLLVLLLASAACDEPPLRSPVAPTATSAPAPAPPSPSSDATAITVGQTVTADLRLSDPPCGTSFGADPPEPCRRFVLAIATAGVLRVQVKLLGSGALTVRVGSTLQWGQTVLSSLNVQAGSSHEIAVALHYGPADQAFELTTSLESR
jgi:hypothetical protein